jgi:hypothetical protein
MSPQRGGAAILLAFGILTMATAMAFLMGEAAARAWRMEGEALQGARASLAADSALAWFLRDGRVFPAPPGSRLFRAPPEVFPQERGLVRDAELLVSHLGPLPGSDPPLEVWKVTVTARLRVLAGDRAVATYRQVREAYVAAPRNEAGARAELRAVRIVR